MLLAFDVGNSNIVLGAYRDRELLKSWRMETDKNKSADEYGMIISRFFEYEGLTIKDVTDVIISTVVPSITYTLQHLSNKYFNTQALVVGPGVRTGLVIKYDNPKQVGADRIVNAVAAFNKYKAPLIVIDFGTATTFCAINEKAEYLGGCIVPGIKISSDALFEKTARLPRVDLEAPGKIICRNTQEGIQAGVVYGAMGETDYIIDRMKKDMQPYIEPGAKITVVATGGMASLVASEVDSIDCVDKLLTLTGLELIFEKNRASAARKGKQERNE